MHSYTCKCGKTVELDDRSRSVGEVEEATGMVGAMNVKNGLTFNYVCSACWARLKPAIQTILDVFKEDANYIHLSSLMRRVEKGNM